MHTRNRVIIEECHVVVAHPFPVERILHPQHLSPAGTPDPGRGSDGAAFSTSGGASYAPIPGRGHGGPSRSSSCGGELTVRGRRLFYSLELAQTSRLPDGPTSAVGRSIGIPA